MGDSRGLTGHSDGGGGGSSKEGTTGPPGDEELPSQKPPANTDSSGESEQAKDEAAGPVLDLKDIFEIEEEVDEVLKDLADSEEDVFAEDLARELREFLAELEKQTPG